MASRQNADTIAQKQISFVSDAIYPYNTGGKEMRLFELATRLVATGYRVDIYTMKWWDGPKNITKDGIQLHAICKKYQLYSGDKRSMKQAILFGLSCLKLLVVSFDAIDVDHMPYFPLFAMKIVCLLKRKPLMATWHEVWGKDYWISYLGPTNGRIAYFLEWLSARMPDKIVAVSSDTASKLRTVLGYKRALATISPGIDLERINAVSKAQKRAGILYSGRLLEHKKIDVLLQAVAMLPAPYNRTPLTIIGDGPEMAHLKVLSAELQLTSRVQFLGFLDEHQELLTYMKAAEIFVSPSVREGFGITILEANACGTMTITSNHMDNASRLLIQEQFNGFTCASEPKALANTIVRALRAPKTLQKQTEIAQAVQIYAWPNILKQLEKAWQ